jgi:hypothetical protein
MPQGVPFTPEIKQVFFRVIHFVESEKNGPQIPINNSTARIMAMLGISESSLINLRKEMKTIRETREAKEREEEEKRSRLRSSSQNQPTNVSHKKENGFNVVYAVRNEATSTEECSKSYWMTFSYII